MPSILYMSDLITNTPPFIVGAPIGIRAANFVFDSLILNVITTSLNAILHFESDPQAMLDAMQTQNLDLLLQLLPKQFLISILLQFAYYFPLEYFGKSTFGKLVTKTVVIRKDGKDCKVLDIFIRTLCRNIPFNALSFIYALITNKTLGWHDIVSKTMVVSKENYNKIMAEKD